MRCLRAAEPLVERGGDWAMLAEAWAALGGEGHDEARRCAEEAVAHGGAEAWLYREAAAVHARALGDPTGARLALDRGFEALAAEPGARARDRCALAGGYVDLLGDRDAARRCLEEEGAASVDDLCALAQGYVEYLGDGATARALIERAMALADEAAPADVGGVSWTLANAHRHALGDRDAAWRVLERGLERATTVAGCLRIACAVASHAQAEPARRPFELSCVTRAESRIVGTDDWIAIADAWHEHRGAPADVRRCLEQALAGRPDAAERARIAFGYRHWLGDAVSADRLSPRGLAPAALVVRNRRLEEWEADPAGLLDWLRGRITPKALATMSVADFGSDRDTHLAALRDIVETGLIPQPLAWHPREVLAITRWLDGEKTDHAARAFACTVLCLDAAGPVYRDGHEPTPALLLESCLALGGEAVARAVGLMVTLAEAFEDYRHELGFAYLGLILAAAARDPHDPRLARLAEMPIATEVDARHGPWRSLSEDLLAWPSRDDPSLAHLATIAARVRGRGDLKG